MLSFCFLLCHQFQAKWLNLEGSLIVDVSWNVIAFFVSSVSGAKRGFLQLSVPRLTQSQNSHTHFPWTCFESCLTLFLWFMGPQRSYAHEYICKSDDRECLIHILSVSPLLTADSITLRFSCKTAVLRYRTLLVILRQLQNINCRALLSTGLYVLAFLLVTCP